MTTPDKPHLLSRTGRYPGPNGFGTSIIGMERFRTGFGELVQETSVVPHGSAAAVEAEILRVGPERVAAFFAEPVIGAGGVFPPEQDYFTEIARICRKYDGRFVEDSVSCGFSR